MARKPYKRRNNHMSSDSDISDLYAESVMLDTLDSLKLSREDLPTNFDTMSMEELEFLAQNAEIYPPAEGNQLMRTFIARKRASN